MSDPEPERQWIDPSQLQPGPIRHESLLEEVLAQAQEVFEFIGPYLGTTLERFEINLMRDADPEREVTIWLAIAYARDEYHEKYLDNELQSDEEEKGLVSALLLISMGVDELSRLKVPPEVGQRLIECYDGLWKQE